jgi:hypothetical protein
MQWTADLVVDDVHGVFVRCAGRESLDCLPLPMSRNAQPIEIISLAGWLLATVATLCQPGAEEGEPMGFDDHFDPDVDCPVCGWPIDIVGHEVNCGVPA